MDSYKKFEIENKNYEYKYDYLGNTNLHNINIREENEKKFDILLDGMLSNNMNKKIDELN